MNGDLWILKLIEGGKQFPTGDVGNPIKIIKKLLKDSGYLIRCPCILLLDLMQ